MEYKCKKNSPCSKLSAFCASVCEKEEEEKIKQNVCAQNLKHAEILFEKNKQTKKKSRHMPDDEIER